MSHDLYLTTLHLRNAYEAIHSAHSFTSLTSHINDDNVKLTSEIWSGQRLDKGVDEIKSAANALGYDLVKRPVASPEVAPDEQVQS